MAVAQLPAPGVNAPEGQSVPFRRATTERVDILPQESSALSGSTQKFEHVIEGSGYIYGIQIDVQATTSGNSANTTFAEDGPWNALDTVVFKDVNGEIVNLGGFDLYVTNLALAQMRSAGAGGGTISGSSDPVQASETFTATTGTGATGGTFKFILRVPAATDRRSLRGLLANQDRGQKYSLRNDYAANTTIWGTAPTTATPTMTVDKYIEFYTVPNPQAPNGAAQQIIPPDFGLIHFLTATNSDTVPAPSSTLNHYLRRVGNTIRFIVMIFRAGTGSTPRATANSNVPTNLRVKVGEDTLFNFTWRYLRKLMHERYGFDFPAGVLVLDTIHDFLGSYAGGELGDDWYYTQALVNAQLIAAYPSGFTASGSLRFVTADMIYVPPKATA